MGPGHPHPAARPSLRGSLLLFGAGLLVRLPEAPLVAAAESIGEIWYRVAPARAAQARVNLRRACEGLAAQGRGTRLARRAATDPEALELLVRRAFRHAARYYLEVALTGGLDAGTAAARMDIETPDEVRDALMTGRPVMIVGAHFGAIELPTIVLSSLVGHVVTAPMETVADPGLQRWFVESRSRVGVNIVPVTDARRTLLRAIRRGESVGMVVDRDLVGNGLPVPLFGHLAPIPAGPGAPGSRDRRARVRGLRAAQEGRPVRRPDDPGAVAHRGLASRTRHCAHGGDRRRVRVDHRRRPGAVVGRVPSDLAGPRPGCPVRLAPVRPASQAPPRGPRLAARTPTPAGSPDAGVQEEPA